MMQFHLEPKLVKVSFQDGAPAAPHRVCPLNVPHRTTTGLR